MNFFFLSLLPHSEGHAAETNEVCAPHTAIQSNTKVVDKKANTSDITFTPNTLACSAPEMKENLRCTIPHMKGEA